jgi:hypothetical protein
MPMPTTASDTDNEFAYYTTRHMLDLWNQSNRLAIYADHGPTLSSRNFSKATKPIQ